MKNLLLVGAGSGSREVLLLVQRLNRIAPEWNVLGFIDEEPDLIGTSIDGLPVFGPGHDFGVDDIFGASGLLNPGSREHLLKAHIESRGYQLATLVAPDVILPADFACGPGTVIMPSTIVSFDVQLGKGVLVGWGAALGHHLRAGDFATILTMALITGGCKVGSRAVIGARATLNVKVSVGAGALVGVGTTVLQDVKEGTKVVAVPRLINTHSAETPSRVGETHG